MPVETPRLRVLVLDDNKDAALVLVMLLIRHGYESIAIHKGADAIDAAQRFRPDCLISDIAMPGVDGYEVARRFRSHPTLSRTTLIALSAHVDNEKAQAAGFDQLLVKPVSASELTDMLYVLNRGTS